MKFNKYSRIIPALLTMGMVACMDDSDNGSGTSVGSEAFDYTKTRTYKLASTEANTFLRISEYNDCDKDKVVVESDTISFSYEFAGEQLIMMQIGDGCKQTLTGGQNTSLVGTWTVVSSMPVNTSFSAEDCELEAGVIEKFTFSSNSMLRSYAVNDFCWATQEGIYYSQALASDTKFETKGCNTIQATDVAGNVASRTLLSFDASTLTATWSMSYNGKSCTRTSSDVEVSTQVCADAYAAYQASGTTSKYDWYNWAKDASRDQYETCMENLNIPEGLQELF